MENRISNAVWGIVLIGLGIIFGGNAIGYWNIHVFFDGWWTMFIIIPSAVGLTRKDVRFSSIIGLAIGLMLLLSAQGFIRFKDYGNLIFPAILILIGVNTIFGGRHHRRIQNNYKEEYTYTEDGEEKKEYKEYTYTDPKQGTGRLHKDFTAIFGGQEIRYPYELFTGANLLAVFGGVELDLRDAIIQEDVVINTTAIFGGCELYLPPNVKVEVSSVPIFGGVGNGAIPSSNENAPTVFINAVSVFGGTDIK